MQIISEQKYLRMSPKKIRPVARLVKKMGPIQALERLPFVRKKAAGVLEKVIKSAIANAKNKGISEESLSFKEIQICDGPRLKRGRPVSRGRWHPIIKRMSHVRVVLESSQKEVKKKPVKKENKVEKKKVK